MNWEAEYFKLRKKFSDGSITKATRKDLEWYLVVLANSRTPLDLRFSEEAHRETNEASAVVVRHLLQVRLGEELHEKSHKLSVIALVVSVLAAGFAGYEALKPDRTVYVTLQPSVAGTNSLVLPVLKSPQITTQSVSYIATTNSKPASNTVSFSRP